MNTRRAFGTRNLLRLIREHLTKAGLYLDTLENQLDQTRPNSTKPDRPDLKIHRPDDDESPPPCDRPPSVA